MVFRATHSLALAVYLRGRISEDRARERPPALRGGRVIGDHLRTGERGSVTGEQGEVQCTRFVPPGALLHFSRERPVWCEAHGDTICASVITASSTAPQVSGREPRLKAGCQPTKGSVHLAAEEPFGAPTPPTEASETPDDES